MLDYALKNAVVYYLFHLSNSILCYDSHLNAEVLGNQKILCVIKKESIAWIYLQLAHLFYYLYNKLMTAWFVSNLITRSRNLGHGP